MSKAMMKLEILRVRISEVDARQLALTLFFACVLAANVAIEVDRISANVTVAAESSIRDTREIERRLGNLTGDPDSVLDPKAERLLADLDLFIIKSTTGVGKLFANEDRLNFALSERRTILALKGTGANWEQRLFSERSGVLSESTWSTFRLLLAVCIALAFILRIARRRRKAQLESLSGE